MRWIITFCLCFCTLILFSSWGFHAHKIINKSAVYTLPAPLLRFYKTHIHYISEHAVDPDKRRYVDPLEAERHFIDIDSYGENPFDSIPTRWDDALLKLSEDTLRTHGILPWQIYLSYHQLVNAFKEKNTKRILRISADLGHYIGDAHSPLHTTKNYNGQLTGQEGIHAFWESRLPEIFAEDYNFFVGQAKYIDAPLAEAWKIIEHSFSLTDSVLDIEQQLNIQFSPDRKFMFENRNNILIRTHSQSYSQAYHLALNGMVEKQMRSSVRTLSSFWYSAWVDAGQPDL